VTGDKSVVDKPATLLWAVRLLYLECVGLAGLTAYLLVLDLTSGDVQVAIAAALTVLAALAAVSVFFVARALGRLAAGARGPAIVVQLFAIAAGGVPDSGASPVAGARADGSGGAHRSVDRAATEHPSARSRLTTSHRYAQGLPC
jgi:hypothetical protein